MHVERTQRGARLVHGGHVVSELPARPGPTDSVFDVLAACVRELAPAGGRLAMLGFAAGGTLAPLRALGVSGPVEAVDLDLTAVPLFRRLARRWSGRVTADRADAAAWLSARTGRYDAIIEDLSMQLPGDVTKPAVSYEALPGLIARRLAPRGVAVVNVLPVAGWPWTRLSGRIAAPYGEVRVVQLEGFDNRILVGARALPDAHELRRRLEASLRALGSSQAGRVQVRSLRRAAAVADGRRDG